MEGALAAPFQGQSWRWDRVWALFPEMCAGVSVMKSKVAQSHLPFRNSSGGSGAAWRAGRLGGALLGTEGTREPTGVEETARVWPE